MLNAFFERLVKHADAIKRPVVPNIYNLPNLREQIITYPDGSYQQFPFRPDTRNHIVRSLLDLIQLAKLRKADTIWYDEVSVVVLFDDEHRDDRAVMELARADSLQALMAMPMEFDQDGFIRLLKNRLAGKTPEPLLAAIRTLNFQKMEE